MDSSSMPRSRSLSNLPDLSPPYPLHEIPISRLPRNETGTLTAAWSTGTPAQHKELVDPDSPPKRTLSQSFSSNNFQTLLKADEPLDPNRPHVLVLCTGGTLTMAPNPLNNGSLEPVQGALGRWMSSFHELRQVEMPQHTLVEYSPLIDSADMGPEHWARIASDIEANYLHFAGFVVCTGTDTMAYAASALSFMLENLGKPVVFTGSQIPLCEAHNDARRNIIASILFAGRDSYPEVLLFFDDKLLRGCRATKTNTHGLGAFASPNLAPLATLGVTIAERLDLVLPPPKAPLKVRVRVETRILVIRLVPGFDDAVLQILLTSDSLKGLVLELYGTGNMQTSKKGLLDMLAKAHEGGMVLVATSQCAMGGVVLAKYAASSALVGVGVVSAGDMTTEAASTKLGHLLGNPDLTPHQVRALMGVTLRGELSPPEELAKPVFPNAFRLAGMLRGT